MFTIRRLLVLVIALSLVAFAGFAYEGRVAAMSSGLPGEVTFADLVARINVLETAANLRNINQEYHDQTEDMRAVWQDHEAENVDATHPMTLEVYIPTDCKLIDRGFLRITLEKFRSYGTGAASGGASTPTSAAGGDHRHRMFEWNGANLLGSETTSAVADHDHAAAVAADGGHDHTYGGVDYLTGFNAKVEPTGVTEGIVGLKVDWVPSYTYEIYTFDSSGTHVHTMTLTDHTHGLVHGIYEGTAATNVTVTINGTDRTAALGGGAGFTTDQDSLDIMQYLAVGWNTISLGSSQLGRIQATYFVKAYLP